MAVLHVALDLLRAGFQPVQETFQRRRVLAFVGQGERQELLDRVVGVQPEARQQQLPPAATAPIALQDLGVKLVGRHEVGARHEVSQVRTRRADRRIAFGVLGKRAPQRPFSVVGQSKKLVLAQAQERTLEHGGQRQIVLGQQQHSPKRHQVHDRELIAQHHAVDARDRHL